jgi:hypothetical protein
MFPKLTDEIRQPEYVGKNRCLPCTVINLGIAAVAAILTAILLAAFDISTAGRIAAGGLVLSGSVATVYLRGYLMPGTPTLTKRYLPLWALRLFGKATDPERNETGDIDVEEVLFDAGALEECPDRNDLCLTQSFESAWRARTERFAANEPEIDLVVERFVDGEDLDESVDWRDITVEERGEAYVALLDERRIAQWESKAAYLSDAAAAATLQDRYLGWRSLGFRNRTEVTGVLRLWLDRCPSCGGRVALGRETVTSCCRERQVLASTCESCGSRLFEADVEAFETG